MSDDRRFQAVQRQRARRLLRALSPRDRAAALLVPALFHASFRHAEIGDDPPGIEGPVSMRGWGLLARSFGLPLPHPPKRSRALVRSVLLAPGHGVVVLVRSGAWAGDRKRVEDRLAAVRGLLQRQGSTLAVELRAEVEPIDPVVAGLLAGRPLAPAGEAVPALLAAGCGDPLAAFLHALRPGGSSLAELLHWNEGVPAAGLADPALLAALWAVQEGVPQELALRAVQLAALSASARRVAGALLPPLSRTTGETLLEVGRGLSRIALLAARRSSAARGLRAQVRGGFPDALTPPLRRHLRELPASSGASERDRMRQLALFARAGIAPAEAPPLWRRVAQLLADPKRGPGVVAEISAIPAGESAAPSDPLNRGPERRLTLASGSLALLRPGAVPVVRRFEPELLLVRLLREAAAGTPIELLREPSAELLASRLRRLAGLSLETHGRIAVEAGGKVLIGDRWLSLQHFGARPRAVPVDPDAPDIGVSAVRPAPGSIGCTVLPAGGGHAALWFADAEGRYFRESVPFAELASHLSETRELLRRGPGPLALVVRDGTRVESVAARSVETAAEANAPTVAVAASWPDGIGFEIFGERFGSGAALGWEAAAMALLATWPPGARERIRFSQVRVRVSGSEVGGLARLYVRSVVRRRLLQWIDRVA